LSVVALALSGALAAQAAKPSKASAFGTINGLGQRSEHERITRAALACAPGVKSTGDCFEPRSMDQVAGHSGTFGAVGAPDLDEFNDPAAHCDNADYLNVAGYPQSRATATANLLACVNHLRQRFGQGVDGAAGLFDADGDLRGPGGPDLRLHLRRRRRRPGQVQRDRGAGPGAARRAGLLLPQQLG